MVTVRYTVEFAAWLDRITDGLAKRRLVRRLERAQHGNLGDTRPVASGVYEMREHYGAGWRMYYANRGAVLIVMLGGGNKSTQPADIKRAIRLAAMLED